MTVDQQLVQQLLNQITDSTDKLKAILTQTIPQNLPIPKSLQPNTLNFNPDICAWMPATGHKGEYELCKDGTNYQFLKKYLEEHEGKATIKDMFYWLFTDKVSIGRKVSKNGNGNGGN